MEKDLSEVYIHPRAAWSKLRTAYELKRNVYIYGGTGYGKTTLGQRFLRRRKHLYLIAAQIDAESFKLPHQDKGLIVMIDDLQFAPDEGVQKVITTLAARPDIWLILAGRSPLPSWLLPAYLRNQLIIISEDDLRLSDKEMEQYFHELGLSLKKEEWDKLLWLLCGNPMGARPLIMELLKPGQKFSEELLDKLTKHFWEYLDQFVYSQWDVEMQEFFLEVSIVGTFDVKLAETITGWNNVEVILRKSMETGNFLTEENGVYTMRYPFRESMRYKLESTWNKEKQNNLYYNAGLAYEMQDRVPEALEMYEKGGNKERISSLLVKNARKNPETGYYYELRHYYLSLPEEKIKEMPELIAAMSMLQAILMNLEESERWYHELEFYIEQNRGSRRKVGQSWKVYLDIALPGRGSVNVKELLVSAAGMLANKDIQLPEVSVTSGIPSMMNGGKDFCEWSRHDLALAKSIGKPVEFALGKYGKGLVELALAESMFEKGMDPYEVSELANKGILKARAGGKQEQVFVGTGILSWLYVIRGKAQEAMDILEMFEEHLQREQCSNRLILNMEALKCRIWLYLPRQAQIEEWMEKQAPQEWKDFCTLDRYRYQAKVRCYIRAGEYDNAVNLLQKITFYGQYAQCTFILMECKLLMAVIHYRRKEAAWEARLMEVIKEAEGYHFVRLISREGAAVLELLRELEKKGSFKKNTFFKEVLIETEKVAGYYPEYLRENKGMEEDQLSERALQILRMQAEGMVRSEIAARLGLNENTVKYHSTQIYRKLGVNSKIAAIEEARRRNLL